MNQPHKLLVIFFGFLLCAFSFAQISKGDEHFDNLEFKKAIPAYQKALKKKKNADNAELLAKIADCFRFIKDYSNAASYYALAIEKGSKNPDVFLHYGMILKSMGSYDDAEKQFNKSLELRPGDMMAMNGIRSCQNIKKWKKKPKEYEVTNLGKINSEKSEFSPVIWKDKLVFVAERESDLIDFTHAGYNDQPYLNVFAAEMDKESFGKPEGFSKKLNSNYHDGPVCFSKDGNTIYFTRVKNRTSNDKEFVNRAKIYIAEVKGNALKKETEFPFNNDAYSVAHPSITDDGKTLFFSSDKPGGFGGMDIYYTKLGASGWEAPVNMGPDINTSGNEEFPFIRTDGILFFASDGLPGFGGLDVFSAYNVSGKWILRRNEGSGINDITDDFGAFFINEKDGYFSSDRPGGKGSDDLYKFNYSDRSAVLEGFVLTALDTAKGAGNQKLLLIDSDGNVVGETRTDKRGYFKFDNLEVNKNYMVKMDETDPAFSEYPRYYYADKDGNIMRSTKEDEKAGKFVFNTLPLKENSISEIDAEDDFTIAGNVLYGEKNTPVANAGLLLKDDKGHVLDETKTNDLGSFVFRKLAAGSNYLIEMCGNDSQIPPDSRIIITNKNGKEVRMIKADSRGKFQLRVLAKEESFISEMSAKDEDLVMDLSGIALGQDKKAVGGSKVFLLDEKGNKIAETTTDKNGAFTFRNLPSSKNYMIALDSGDPALSGMDKVYIADKNGRVVSELRRTSDFTYKILSADKNVLTEMFVDDPWLEVLNLKNTNDNKQGGITIIENVYYNTGDWKFDDNGKRVLDKVVKIMKDNPNITIELSSHTDSRADDNFNLKLSDKRAKFAVNYIISSGINKKRVTAVGYGEKKLINNCGNGVDCTDEQHAQNRRTEFKIIEVKK